MRTSTVGGARDGSGGALLAIALLFGLSACVNTSLIDRWKDPGFSGPALHKVLVVGEAKRGKSTFVNALIGRPILPTAVSNTGKPRLPTSK